jgi:hypothetical protein
MEGFDPPAPIARSVIVGPAGTCSGVPLLVDSGADVSLIPQWEAAAVGANPSGEGVALRSFNDSEATYDVVHLRVQFLRYTFQGAFVITDGTYGILGRNILNQLVLTLEGPQQRWSA